MTKIALVLLLLGSSALAFAWGEASSDARQPKWWVEVGALLVEEGGLEIVPAHTTREAYQDPYQTTECSRSGSIISCRTVTRYRTAYRTRNVPAAAVPTTGNTVAPYLDGSMRLHRDQRGETHMEFSLRQLNGEATGDLALRLTFPRRGKAKNDYSLILGASGLGAEARPSARIGFRVGK